MSSTKTEKALKQSWLYNKKGMPYVVIFEDGVFSLSCLTSLLDISSKAKRRVEENWTKLLPGELFR